MARIELWNGDICDLEVDAIVNAANVSLWMSTGVGGAIKRAGGDAIEFEAVRQGPVALGDAVVTGGGTLPVKAVIHAVSLDRDRRTSGAVIEARRALGDGRGARARGHEHRVPGARHRCRRVPARRGRRDHRRTVREELPACPTISHVIFALRGRAAYDAFAAALSTGQPVANGAA